MLQVRVTHQHPLRFVTQTDERGREVQALAPGHPTRPARAYETDCWWEDASGIIDQDTHYIFRLHRPEFRGGWVPAQNEP